MKKSCISYYWGKVLLLTAFLASMGRLNAQTITTPYTGSFTFFASPANVAFVVENTNSAPVILTGVSQYCETTENNSVWELYYSSTSLSGAGSPVPGPLWTLIATSSPVTVTANGIVPVFTTLNFNIPPGAQYRFVMKNTGPGNTRYVLTPSPAGNLFSNGGVNLKVGNFQIAGANVGYSGAGTALTTNPRYWHGSITFQPAGPCTDPPIAGNVVSNANPACSGADFTLNLSGGTFGTGQTYQWQSSPDNVNWANLPNTTASITISQTASTFYRAIVNCGTGADTSTSLQVGSTICYCTSAPSGVTNEDILSVTVNGVTNTSDCAVPAPGPGSILNRYSNFYPLGALTNLIPGLTVDFSVGVAECDVASTVSHGCAIWIDFNRDGDFLDAGERVYADNTTFPNPRTITGNITVPATALTGVTGMRIIVAESFSGTGLQPCMTFTSGETEDYLVNIIPPIPCSGPPAAGTAAAFPTTVCLGQSVSLSNSGASLAIGQNYQWQVSTDNGAIWNNIPGATGFSASVTQSTTSLYRFRIICENTNDTSYTNSAQVITPALLNGSYTIDKNATNLYPNTNVFNSFNSAYNAMKCGIAGAITMNVLPGSGPYNEQLIMSGIIPGASATNTITFNGNGNTITFNTTASEPAVIKLRGIDYIRFDSLVIEPTGASNGFGVHLTSNANNNIIRNCTININTSSTATGFAGIVISGSETSATGTGTASALCDNNEMLNNTITGGYYGMTCVATFTGGAHGNNLFKNNRVLDYYGYGIYVSGTYNTVIDGNTFSRPARTNAATTVNAIYFTSQSNSARINGNRITNPFGANLSSTSAFNGISFSSASPSSGNDDIVSNNLICKMNGNGAITGISNSGTANVWFIHNTISLDSLAASGTPATRGFSMGTAAAGNLFFDNLISVTRGGPGNKHAIYLTGLFLNANNNNYFVNATGGNSFLGYYSSDRATLADWKAATGQEASSYDVNPVFVDPTNVITGFAPGNAGIDNKGLNIGITNDILGAIRNPATPDIGAYEFTAPGCTIPVMNGTTVITPSGTVCQNTYLQLNLNIGPFGSGQTFQWQTSTSATGPFSNFGAPKLTPDTVILASTTLYYRAIVSCGASIDSSGPVLITVDPAMPAGTYTIDKNNPTNYTGVAGANFNSFNDARAAMVSCGILGPVVFNVVSGSGPYYEQLKLDSIRGASAINTITFNGNGNTIALNPASPPTNTERAVIKLNGADHIRFDSLTIDASGASFAYGYGVQLINNADSNVFRRCHIISSLTSTAQSFNGIVINATDIGPIATGNTLCDSNTFDRNIITGGFHGITLVGSAAQQLANNKFTNNRIEDFYSVGIYIAGTYNTLIEGNKLSRPTRNLVTNTYGIYVTGAQSLRLNISKNRITRLFSGMSMGNSPQYGIYHNNVDATAGNDNTVSNNLIYGLDGDGTIYALYNNGSDGTRYYHNTISLDNTLSIATGATRAFYQSGAAVGIQFINNVVSISRGGTGSKHAIYLETPTSEVESDHNDLYIGNAGGVNNYVGYYNTNQTTLADWQAATNDDGNSYSINPTYVDSANGNYKPGILSLDNKGIWVVIPTDITGAIRNPATPDIGAYEFAPPICINPPVAGTASVTPNAGLCLETPITLNLTGHSPLGTLTIQWQSAPMTAGPWTDISPVLYSPQYSTTLASDTFFRAVVICGSGAPVYSTITSVSLNSVVLAGTYTIDNGQPTTWPGPPGSNFNSFQAAVNAMLCGITGPVVFNVQPGTTGGVYNEQIRIPHIRNTSSINTVTFQSASGDPTSVNLSFGATTAGGNYTVKLDSAKYITFRNMTISATGSTYGRAVELAGNASFNNFINCTINTTAVTNTSNTVCGIFASSLKGESNIIRRNTINNGAIGIYFWGTGTGNNLTRGHIIDSNTVNGSYSYGIYANYFNRAKLLSNTVNITAPRSANSYGIYASDCDSSYTISGNTVNINGTTTTVYGIYVNNSDTAIGQYGKITANTVTAATGNTGALYGLYIGNSPGHDVLNNVISVKTNNTIAYGLYSADIGMGKYFNNSINNTSPNGSYANAAAYFGSVDTTDMLIRNNIFSNRGSGRAMVIGDAIKPFGSNYNMLYASGSVLVQTLNPGGSYANLEEWKNAFYWDRYSIAYPPAFTSNTDLHPDLANPNVWAMHGRGVQIKGNVSDFYDNYRPDSLTAGVPDLGAFEFYPTALPTLLTPIPAGSPAPGLTQAFMYGTDTVCKIRWGNNVPPTAGVRRYSGVAPSGLNGPDSMFFYTQMETPGNYDYSMSLNYIDPWQGSIPEQWMIGLGRTTPSNAWVVGFNSNVDFNAKRISQSGLTYMNKFTGLINPYAPPVMPDKDSSNRGRRFWVAYAINQLNAGSTQEMVLYLSAQEPAQVQVKINGTNWVRNFLVPANTVVQTEFLPKNGPQSAYLNASGLTDRGISIQSDVPIVVYAHATGSASSGAAMLLPVSTWGYEYKTLSITQNYGAGALSYFYVVADNDNTKVEITPTVAVQNAGMAPGVPYIVTLNKGQVFQVVASSQTQELTGSTVKSIPNSADTCYPIAVFSGTSRSALSIGCGSGGDFMMQQNFPATAWGKHYLTAPSSASTSATDLQTNVFRVAVRDPSTVVKVNGNLITAPPINAVLINNHYYQYQSNAADYIESDKPIMVAQFLTGACTGVGDPEMIYLSPIEQGINKVGFYRNNRLNIVSNLLTLIIPTNGLSSLLITDGTDEVTPDYIYPHPQNGNPSLRGVDYSVVVKLWVSEQKQVKVQSDSSFTAITYGLGSVESYGYNAGTLVRNLTATGSISNTLNVLGGSNEYTCAGSSFAFSATMAIKPTTLTFRLSAVPNLSPNADVTLTNPVPVDSFTVNWTKYYVFALPGNYTFSAPGLYPLQISYTHPDIESCDHSGRDVTYIQVVPAPKTNFIIDFTSCVGNTAQFIGEQFTANGITVNQWDWTFHDGSTASGDTAYYTYNTTGTYPVNLHTITPDGCIGDSTKQVVVNPRPIVDVVDDSLVVCTGGDVTFDVLNPQAGEQYLWYTTPAGGVAIDTTVSFTVIGVTGIVEYYVEAVSAAGCPGATRKKVVATPVSGTTTPVAAVSVAGADFVTFNWVAVPGATGYEVSINGGPFITPSTGSTGLSHTVSGLGVLDSVNFVVKSLSSCGDVTSAPVKGCANSSASVAEASLTVCTGADATFTIQAPASGITYTWHNSLSGGVLLGTGPSFTVPNVNTTTNYYVQQQSSTGCIGIPRTPLVVSVLPPLGQITAVVDSVGVNAIKFRWNAVAGAASYQVSTDGGTTFITPSSGPTGLTHTVTGLQPVRQVTLIVRAVGTVNCQASISQAVTGQTLPDGIYIPNTFTPNDDGVNDVLLVYGYIIQEMHFMVYNQWGEKIFESRNQSIGWDGRHNGKPQPSGVYIFVGRFILKDGTLVERKGSINLIR